MLNLGSQSLRWQQADVSHLLYSPCSSSSGLSICKSTRTFLQGPAQVRPIQIGNKWSILNVIIERYTQARAHTHTLSASPFHGEVLQVSPIHLDLAVSMCPPSKGHRRLWQFSDFVKGRSGQWFIRHPALIFQKPNDGHESCYALTAPFPDQWWPLHTFWMADLLMLQSCLKALS